MLFTNPLRVCSFSNFHSVIGRIPLNTPNRFKGCSMNLRSNLSTEKNINDESNFGEFLKVLKELRTEIKELKIELKELKTEIEFKQQNMKRELERDEEKELYAAIEYGYNEKAKRLINSTINDKNYKSDYFIHCCKKGRVELVKYFLELGENVNLTYWGSSPLMEASKSGNIEIVQLLIDAKADVNYIFKDDFSALAHASTLEMFELLLLSGASIEKCGRPTLLNASRNGNTRIVQRLIDLGVDINFAERFYGCTPLHYACTYNNLELVKLLLKNGADQTIKDRGGRTAIENHNTKKSIKNFFERFNSKISKELFL